MTTNQTLHSLWQACSASGDFSSLVAFVSEHPDCSPLCDHEYPILHRVADFVAEGRAFRVCRCVACGERLFVFPLTIRAATEIGVPYELTGVQLQRWIADETAEPSDGPVDWSRYLHTIHRTA